MNSLHRIMPQYNIVACIISVRDYINALMNDNCTLTTGDTHFRGLLIFYYVRHTMIVNNYYYNIVCCGGEPNIKLLRFDKTVGYRNWVWDTPCGTLHNTFGFVYNVNWIICQKKIRPLSWERFRKKNTLARKIFFSFWEKKMVQTYIYNIFIYGPSIIYFIVCNVVLWKGCFIHFSAQNSVL